MLSIHVENDLHLPFIGNGKCWAGVLTKLSCSGTLMSRTITRSRGKILVSRNSIGELPWLQFPLQTVCLAEALACCMTLYGPSFPQDSSSDFARFGDHHVTLYICAMFSISGLEVLGISTVQMLLLIPFTGQSYSSNHHVAGSPHWATRPLLLGTKVTALLYQEGLLTCWWQVLIFSLYQTRNNITPHTLLHDTTEITGIAFTKFGLKTDQFPSLHMALFK